MHAFLPVLRTPTHTPARDIGGDSPQKNGRTDMSADDMRAAAEKTRTSARPAGSSRTDRVSVSVSIARRHFARKRAPVDKPRGRYRASRLGLYRPGQAALLGSPEG